MKSNSFIICMALGCIIAGSVMTGCGNKSASDRTGDTLVLNASDTLCFGSGTCLNWTDSITGSYSTDSSLNVGGGYWNQTFTNTGGFRIGSFKLTHYGATYINEEDTVKYWGGFTSGANGDNRNFGYADTTHHSGSVNWVKNQWGVMAGGGLTTPPTTVKGNPYLIGYWDYYSDSTATSHTLQISLNGDSLFTPEEIWICNHPWPYYGNLFGDGFARPLNQPGDYFKLIIHGVPVTGQEKTQEVELAIFNSDEDTLTQSSNWQHITINNFGAVKAIYFTLESTDETPPYGPNTAVYFNLDKLKVTKTGGVAPAATAAPRAKAAARPAIEVTDLFPIASYTGGDVTVHDAATGKQVLKTTVKAGEKPNLSHLPAGKYHLRHGHKTIPLKKVN
ncbi:MAG: DUF4465 domain-containing protein [Prevotellaceae bacterium]|jgi:hypothetical protein|nr:DUF4465 domain-containing protein [Prevotellaceae bacterium]